MPALGAGGREFESRYPDRTPTEVANRQPLLVYIFRLCPRNQELPIDFKS